MFPSPGLPGPARPANDIHQTPTHPPKPPRSPPHPGPPRKGDPHPRALRSSGGDGIRRSVRFLARKGTASILSERRVLRPKGLEGGDDGRPGKNLLVRNGRRRALPAKTTLELRRDDLLVIETPGGGGWGPRERRGRWE